MKPKRNSKRCLTKEECINRKIELIPDDDGWCWIILEYNNGWYNVGSGIEPTYEEAAKAAKIEYDK